MKNALKSKSEDDFGICKRFWNCVTSSMCKAKIDYFQRQLDDFKGDPKASCKLMKKVLPSKNKSTKIDKLIVNGVDLTDHKGIN